MNLAVNDPKMQSLLERLFENHTVRIMHDEKNEPLFVAKDICDCLEISNSRDAIRSIDQDDLASVKTTSGGQIRSMTFVNEAGLYCLIFKSRKPVARRFKNWVTREVIPFDPQARDLRGGHGGPGRAAADGGGLCGATRYPGHHQ